MAIKEKEELKKLFETLDKPTQQDFADWLDSFVHVNEYTVVQLIKATIAQAKAGTDNNTYITPLSLLETIRENTIEKATNNEAIQGTNDAKYITPLSLMAAILDKALAKATSREAIDGTDEDKYINPRVFKSAWDFLYAIKRADFGETFEGRDNAKFITPAALKNTRAAGPIKRTLTYDHTDTLSYTGTIDPNAGFTPTATTIRLIKIAKGLDVNNGIISFAVVVNQDEFKCTVKMTIAKGIDGKPTIQKDFKSNSSGPNISGFHVSGSNDPLKLDIYMFVIPDTSKGNNIQVDTFSVLNSGINLLNTPDVVFYQGLGPEQYVDQKYYVTESINPSVDGDTVIEYFNGENYTWFRETK